MPVTWIEHKGIKILYSDFSGLKKNEDLFIVLEDAVKNFTAAEGKVRHILNFTGASMTKEFMAKAKELGKQLPLNKTEKDAYVGIDGLKKVLLQAYLMITGEPANTFDTVEQALDWIIK